MPVHTSFRVMFQLSCLRVCLSIYHPFIHMSVHTSFSALFPLPCFRVCLSIYHPFIHMPVHTCISFSVMFQLSYLDPSTIHYPYDSTYIPQCFVSTVMLENMLSIYHSFIHMPVYTSFSVMFQLSCLRVCLSINHPFIYMPVHTSFCVMFPRSLSCLIICLPIYHPHASTHILQCNVSTVMLKSMFVHLPSVVVRHQLETMDT